MNLQQLRIIQEIERQDCNVSRAAAALNTSQPAASRQVSMLEKELGVQLFRRHGKRLIGITDEGREVLTYAGRMLRDELSLRRVADEFVSQMRGVLTVATTPTLARYLLPVPVKEFSTRCPDVHLHVVVGESDQSMEALVAGEADIALVPASVAAGKAVTSLPWLRLERSLIALPDCPLLGERRLTLKKIAAYPLIAFETPAVSLKEIFRQHKLAPTYAITTSNPDVMKAYAGLGVGVGIISSIAFDEVRDAPLVARDASHLFPGVDISITLSKGAYVRGFALEFINLLSPQLTKRVVAARLSG